MNDLNELKKGRKIESYKEEEEEIREGKKEEINAWRKEGSSGMRKKKGR